MDVNEKWQVSKYAWWDYNKCKWQIPTQANNPSTKITLLLQGTQFLLVHKKTVMESFMYAQNPNDANLNLRNNCLAVVVKCGNKYRKFKVLFDSREEAETCVNCMKKFIKSTTDQPFEGAPAQNIDESRTMKNITCNVQLVSKDCTIPEVIARIMSKSQPSLPGPHSIPEDYPLESAVKLCLLDPGFSQLVDKVEKIITGYK